MQNAGFPLGNGPKTAEPLQPESSRFRVLLIDMTRPHVTGDAAESGARVCVHRAHCLSRAVRRCVCVGSGTPALRASAGTPQTRIEPFGFASLVSLFSVP